MRRWTFALLLGLSAVGAIVLAPRLFARVEVAEPEVVEPVSVRAIEVAPVVPVEVPPMPVEPAWVEVPPPVPPRPAHLRVNTGPEVHPIHIRRTDTDGGIPELAEPVAPVIPDDFWPAVPACGMG